MTQQIPSEKVKKTTEELLLKLKVTGSVEVLEEIDGLKVSISSPDSALLIGWRGAGLVALEYLVRLLFFAAAGKSGEPLPEVHLDIEGYKQHQVEELTEMARRTAQKVRETKAPEVLRPMNGFERRTIHVALADVADIVTESVGVDPNRRIVIKPKV